MTLEELETVARRFVNERRKEIGLRGTGRLRRGWPKSSLLCPIATSLECCGVHTAGYVGMAVLLTNRHGVQREFNEPAVAEFMKRFDGGEFPHLELPKSQIKLKGEVVA